MPEGLECWKQHKKNRFETILERVTLRYVTTRLVWTDFKIAVRRKLPTHNYKKEISLSQAMFYFIMSYVCLFLVSLAVIIVKHKNIFYHLIKQPDFS